MLMRAFQFIFIAVLVTVTCSYNYGQSAENRTPGFSTPAEDERERSLRPLNLRETLEKMRVAKEEKDHKEMLARGEEALRISEQLENAFAATGKLSEKEFVKLAAVEKIVKKIRSGLGGDDDDGEEAEPTSVKEKSLSPADAVKSLRSTTLTLFDELKKTTRFTISAAAIQSSNAVLKLARFLRIRK